MEMAFDASQGRSDAEILAAYAGGDPEAARILAARHLPPVLRLAARLLGDPAEAEDVAQEAMLRLWRAAPGWRDGGAKVSTWLYRVTVNLCTDRLRRRRFVALEAVGEPEDGRISPEAMLQDEARVRALDQALAALPERQRLAVVLRHVEGMANPEIAEVMEIGVGAVESLTARGRRALARALVGRRDALGYER
ncbi:MAG: RNA polymerase sigma factor [Paracoccaceae bacterium]